MAQAFELSYGRIEKGAGERSGLRMSKNNEDFHFNQSSWRVRYSGLDLEDEDKIACIHSAFIYTYIPPHVFGGLILRVERLPIRDKPFPDFESDLGVGLTTYRSLRSTSRK